MKKDPVWLPASSIEEARERVIKFAPLYAGRTSFHFKSEKGDESFTPEELLANEPEALAIIRNKNRP